MDDVTAVILAGGKATRLGGVAKHALVIDGAPIVERQRALLAARCREVVISGARVDGLRTVEDDPAHAGAGPLAGIAAALAAATMPWLLVVAGDMPAVVPALLDLLLGARAAGDDAVAIRIGGWPEPLLCALRVAAAGPALAALLAARRYRASGLLAALPGVRWLDEAAVRAVDPTLASLRNINRPEDLRS